MCVCFTLRLLQKNFVDDLTQCCTVYIVRCTVNHETEERREEKKIGGGGGGIEFLKTKIKFLKNVKFFWIRVTKVLCVWRGGGEDVCERDDDNILQMRRRRKKKTIHCYKIWANEPQNLWSQKTGGRRFSWVKGRNFCFEIEFVFSCLNRTTTTIFF
jgi:hypothetical protein